MYIRFAASRRVQGLAAVCISSMREALKSVTRRRERTEKHGRKRGVSNRGVEALDRARRRVLVKAARKNGHVGACDQSVPCFTSSPTVPLQFPYNTLTVPLPQKTHFP